MFPDEQIAFIRKLASIFPGKLVFGTDETRVSDWEERKSEVLARWLKNPEPRLFSVNSKSISNR
jgi:hypothetical protein